MANEKTTEPKTTKAPKKVAAKKKASKSKRASSPRKTAAPKTSKKPEFGAKSAFIKTQPASMTAKEVVEAAKAKGIVLSENLVYSVRSAGKAKGKSTGAKKAVVNTKGAKSKTLSASSASLESTLRNAIAELGLARARAVFEAVERAFKG